jgi:hypothetical protein
MDYNNFYITSSIICGSFIFFFIMCNCIRQNYRHLINGNNDNDNDNLIIDMPPPYTEQNIHTEQNIYTEQNILNQTNQEQNILPPSYEEI